MAEALTYFVPSAIGAPPWAMFVRLKTYESAGGKP